MFPDILREAGFTFAAAKPRIYTAFGTAMHSGAAHALREKKSGTIISPSDIAGVSIDKFRSEISDGVEWDDVTPSIKTAEGQISKAAAAYHEFILPGIEPVSIEEPLTASRGDVTLSGHADVICPDKIRDLKTGQVSASYFIQMGGYSLLAKANNFPRPVQLVIDQIKRAKKSEMPKCIINNDVTANERIAWATLGRIAADIATFKETGDPVRSFPVNPGSKFCSPKYCAAWGTDFCQITKRRPNDYNKNTGRD